MKYLKKYNESTSSNDDDLTYEYKIKIMESCYLLPNTELYNICQPILDDYPDGCITITDGIQYINKKFSGESTGFLPMENYIVGWRKEKDGDTQIYGVEDDFDELWYRYIHYQGQRINRPKSKIGTVIYMKFDDEFAYPDSPKINDVERELIRITRKIEAEVGKENVKFEFDWGYPEMINLRKNNGPITDYTLLIYYKKKNDVELETKLEQMKYLKKYNESVWEPNAQDIEKVFDLELEYDSEFSVAEYDITPLESYLYEDKIMFTMVINFNFEDSPKFSSKFDDIAKKFQTPTEQINFWCEPEFADISDLKDNDSLAKNKLYRVLKTEL